LPHRVELYKVIKLAIAEYTLPLFLVHASFIANTPSFFMKKEVAMHFRFSFACALLACAVASVAVRAESATPANLSRGDLKKMIREAHTSEDYLTLASYFRWRQQEFEQQARSEKAEWDRRSTNSYLAAAKYPNPVDSSRNRYEYFTYEAQKMGQQAAHYESLSATVDH
jgi:hypothetical protein